jgi:hypothetical protein
MASGRGHLPKPIAAHECRGPERDRKVHVRIGMVHLDDLEERSDADGDVGAGLENATAHGGLGDVVQHACRPLLR